MLASGKLKMQTIAFLGARSAGKSNYIGALIRQLEDRYESEVGFSIESENTFDHETLDVIASRELYERRYGDMLFGDHPQVVPQTSSATTNADIRVPLIYRLTCSKSRTSKSVLLSFFDAAGEDFEVAATMARLYPYLACAAGIVFLLDPFEFEGIIKSLPLEEREKLERTRVNPLGIVEAVVKEFEEQEDLKGHEKLKLPVAFAVAKSDELDQLFERLEDAPFLQETVHQGGFNELATRERSASLRACVTQWLPKGLYRGLKNRFQCHRFFAVSALGQRPSPDNTLEERIHPRNLADPLLWILFRLRYLSESPDSLRLRRVEDKKKAEARRQS
jgi:GTPase SAR1 family protein